jgi:predicted house-cleaning noncanonical NTP pyrophosphatase (MazG superfamily)
MKRGSRMKLIDKSKIDFVTIEPYEYASEELEVVLKEDIEELPEVKAIPIEELEKAIEIMENMATSFGTYIDRADALEILDKLIESEGKQDGCNKKIGYGR